MPTKVSHSGSSPACFFTRVVLFAAALSHGAMTMACAPAAVLAPEARGVPGFDTREYPGDDVMRLWRHASPYRWVGYYLESPCHPRSSWMGRRETLRQIGWGIALLYVGEQDWRAIASAPRGPGLTPPGEAPRCADLNLTNERGAADAAEARAAAFAEGFGAGTVVFLNVERVDSLSDELATYVRAWIGTLLDDGEIVPGLYAHAHNAAELHAIATEQFGQRQRPDPPRLWVASSVGFDILAAPAESGIAGAAIWQGIFNTRETWGGVTMTIDVNVADSVSPSGM